jgi:transposase-like protein/IS1 family transposase
MFCPYCQGHTRKFGKNRNGSQRYRCDACKRTLTDAETRPVDRRRLAEDKAVIMLRMVLEGMSVRSTERLTQVHRDTILATMVDAGKRCKAFMEKFIQGVQVDDVQADEIWSFVGAKQKTCDRQGCDDSERGDSWCFVGMTRYTKLVLAWHLDKRTPEAANIFCKKLRAATTGRFQLSTDGYKPYLIAVWEAFRQGIDFAQLIKVYSTTGNKKSSATRYSPGEVIDAYAVPCLGTPDIDQVCTSHSERKNLSLRMAIRRWTRLTNAHSKKWANHEAALGLWFAYYNFCRVHMTLKTTPAVAAGLTDHTWTVAELLERIG